MIGVNTATHREGEKPQDMYLDSFSRGLIQASGHLEPHMIKVNLFPQDPCVDKAPATVEMEPGNLGINLDGKRFKGLEREDGLLHSPVISPDAEGNLTYDPAMQNTYVHVNAFAGAVKTLEMVESCLGHKVKWHSGLEQLPIEARSEEGRSEYDQHNGKEAIRFGYSIDKPAAAHDGYSFDSVAHETSHAIIDGLRPYFDRDEEDDRFFTYEQIKTYPESNSHEYRAFNESLADCTSLLGMLGIEENRTQIAQETGGDLGKESRLSRFSEHRAHDGDNTSEISGVRDFINDFKYVPIDDPSLWSPSGPDDLSIEPHSFSRIFSGAIYDIFRGLYERSVHKLAPDGIPDTAVITGALKEARDVLAPIFFKAIDFSAPSGINYKSAALCMMKADALLNKGQNRDLLARVFQDRKIISESDLGTIEPKDATIRLRMDRIPGTEKQALRFLRGHRARLKEMGLNAGDFNRAEVTVDRWGNTFMHYLALKEVRVGSDRLDYVDDGVTMAFDNKGSLISIDRFAFHNKEIIVDNDFVSKDLPVPQGDPPDTSHTGEVFKKEQPVQFTSSKIAEAGDYIGEAAIAGDVIILGGDAMDVTVVNKKTGEKQVFPGIRGRLSIGPNNELVVSGEKIHSLDIQKGTVRWAADPAPGNSYRRAVIDSKGEVYVGSSKEDGDNDVSRLFRLEGETGTPRWETERSGKPPATAYAQLLSSDEKTIFCNTARVLYKKAYKTAKFIAFDAATGEEKWGFKTKDPVWDKVSNYLNDSDGNVVLFCQKGEIYSLKPDSGSMNWSARVDRGILFYGSALMMPNDMALLRTFDSVYAVDLKNGREKWSYPLKDITAMTSDYQGNAYVVADKKLYKFDPRKEVVSCADLGFYARSVNADGEGNIYAVNGKELTLIQMGAH